MEKSMILSTPRLRVSGIASDLGHTSQHHMGEVAIINNNKIQTTKNTAYIPDLPEPDYYEHMVTDAERQLTQATAVQFIILFVLVSIMAALSVIIYEKYRGGQDTPADDKKESTVWF